MAITPGNVILAAGEGGVSYTSWSRPLAAGAPAGSTVLGVVTLSAATSLPRNIDNITDSKGNTWAVDLQPVISGATLQTGLVRGTISTALVTGDTVTFNITPGSNQWGVVLQAFTGLASAPLDVVGSNAPGNSATGTVSTASATTQAAELVFAGFGTALGTNTAGTGFTLSGTGAGTTRQSTAEYRIVSAVGTQTATMNFNPASTYVGVVATYKALVASNATPTANAGSDVTGVEPFTTVTLTGSGIDTDGTITDHTWRQIKTGSEPTVVIAGAGTGSRTVVLPATMDQITYTFGLTVTDNAGAVSAEDTKTVTVLPWDRWLWVGGTFKALELPRFWISGQWDTPLVDEPVVAVVISDDTTPNAGDQWIADHLLAKGVDEVQFVDDIDATYPPASLYVISPYAQSSTVDGKLTNVAVPVINSLATSWDDAGLSTAGGTTTTSITDVNVADATHPLAAGLAAGTQTILSSGNALRRTSTFSAEFDGVIEVPGEVGGFVIGGYEAGSLMPGGVTAPARRVVLGFDGGVYNTSGAVKFNTSGAALFDAAVTWALGSPGTTTVPFTASTATIPNPERGFFQYTETHYQADNTGHTALNATTLASDRLTLGRAVVFRYYVIEKYRTLDTIDQTYLNLIAADLTAARAAGVKLILRFTYSTSGDMTPPYDADTTVARTVSHIGQLAPTLNTYADVIDSVEAGFIGMWGEWYYTDNYGDLGVLTTQNWADRKAVLDALLDYLDDRIYVLVRYPGIKERYFAA